MPRSDAALEDPGRPHGGCPPRHPPGAGPQIVTPIHRDISPMTTRTTSNLSEVASTSAIESRRVARQASLVTMTRRETMYRLALAAQVRHPHLVGHLERVAQYSAMLAEAVGRPTNRS